MADKQEIREKFDRDLEKRLKERKVLSKVDVKPDKVLRAKPAS